MKKMFLFYCFSAIVFITSLSCERKFDEPPVYQDPAISVDISIRELKSMHKNAGSFDSIRADHVISGVVTANDKTGNIFKSIILQDTSGGISIKLDGSNLYTSYPVGRKIFVRLKNLVISDYGGLLQVGAGIDISDPSRPSLAAIPSNLFDKYLVKGSVGNEAKAKVLDVAQLGTSMQD